MQRQTCKDLDRGSVILVARPAINTDGWDKGAWILQSPPVMRDERLGLRVSVQLIGIVCSSLGSSGGDASLNF